MVSLPENSTATGKVCIERCRWEEAAAKPWPDEQEAEIGYDRRISLQRAAKLKQAAGVSQAGKRKRLETDPARPHRRSHMPLEQRTVRSQQKVIVGNHPVPKGGSRGAEGRAHRRCPSDWNEFWIGTTGIKRIRAFWQAKAPEARMAWNWMELLRENWPGIREQIREKRYKLQPVLRVEIPKPNGEGNPAGSRTDPHADLRGAVLRTKRWLPTKPEL